MRAAPLASPTCGSRAHAPPAARLSGQIGRDAVGRPFGGAAPGGTGHYSIDPEEAQRQREADEANEILELRSMGVRTAIEANKEANYKIQMGEWRPNMPQKPPTAEEMETARFARPPKT